MSAFPPKAVMQPNQSLTPRLLYKRSIQPITPTAH
jgi:hypothetical protein